MHFIQVILSKVATSCTKVIALIPGRKFSEILKRGTLQNPCQKVSVVESVFNKIAGMDSRSQGWTRRDGLSIFAEKKFPSRMFSSGYIKILQSSLK